MTNAQETPSLSVDAGGEAGLIAHLHGARPPAPAWFSAALAHAPDRRFIAVAGARIDYAVWGPQGAPGLLLLHGNGAHADWWSFLAPFFADHYRVAAVTWSGMGDSDWRARYSLDLFMDEALQCAEAAGLFAAAAKPVVAAHSFGGFVAMGLAARFGTRLGGVIPIDCPVERPGAQPDRPPPRARPNRVYPTLEHALARFRLAPAQPCEALYAVDHVARGSIKQAPEGFTWKFDPFIWAHMEMDDAADLFPAAQCPMAVVYGERSRLMSEETLAHMRAIAPAHTAFVAIPDADHHLLLDQPLATVAALRALLAAWG